MNRYLMENLDHAVEGIKLNWDVMIIVDGLEGAGKSLLAIQSATYIDPNFNVDKIVFRPEDFSRVVLSNKKSAIVFDEAYSGLMSREAITKITRSLVKLTAEMRQRNNIVFIVMPSILELHKYIAVHRSRLLINIPTPKNTWERGVFHVYDRYGKATLYGKKRDNLLDYWTVVKPKFEGRFSGEWPNNIREEEYLAKKAEAMNKYDEPEAGSSALAMLKAKHWLKQRNILIKEMVDSGVSQVYISNLIGLQSPKINTIYHGNVPTFSKKGRENNIGGKLQHLVVSSTNDNNI